LSVLEKVEAFGFHRLFDADDIRRIAQGLHEATTTNRLIGKPIYPDLRDLIDALARKSNVSVVVGHDRR
jgi:hypothetical protein